VASALFTPSHAVSDNWIADTGTTVHMTLNHHWFKSYKPCQIPVHLADNNVIYAAGMGLVVFILVKYENALRQIELSNVLHIPLLGNNLLCLDIDQIRNSTMCF